MSEPFPPFDFERSPFTGWGRDHWEHILARMTYGYVLAAEKRGSMARALYPDDRRNLPDATDALESFARMASAWGAWLKNPNNPAEVVFEGRSLNIEEILRQALVEGTDANNPYTYWGDMAHMSQHIVESADMAATIWYSRTRVFDKMTKAEQDQVMDWLGQVDDKGTYPDNWILFTALAQTVRLKMGYPVPVEELDFRLRQTSAFYRGDGWYLDGELAEYELYNAWMFSWHFLLWAEIDGDRLPDLKQQVLQRAKSFIAGFQYFFGANGSFPVWGRSLVYRFAALAAFETGYWQKIAPDDPGMLRRLTSGNIKYFYDHGLFDPEEHYVRQGYHGDFPQANESYISPGSPYWCCHGLFALSFDKDDPFWTATETPLPVEREDFDLALPTPGFVVSGRKATGQVLLLNSKAATGYDAWRYNYSAKYSKFTYSSHLPFNVLWAKGSYAPDAMIGLLGDDNALGHRLTTYASEAAPGFIWCDFNEEVLHEPQKLVVAVCLVGDVQVRLAYVLPTLGVRAFEAPGALGLDRAVSIVRRSNKEAGWEYAEGEGRALGIRRLLGYDTQQASMPFRGYGNINVAYPYAEQPVISVSKFNAMPHSLASLSLVRPAAFDPAKEFGGYTVNADRYGTFKVAVPDGEEVWAALGFEKINAAEVGGYKVTGQGLKVVRVNKEAGTVTGVNLSKVAGVATLSKPGTLVLKREQGGARVTTSTGVSLAVEWLGGKARKVEVRTLAGSWEVVDGTEITDALVTEWANRTERTLVEFRVTV